MQPDRLFFYNKGNCYLFDGYTRFIKKISKNEMDSLYGIHGKDTIIFSFERIPGIPLYINGFVLLNICGRQSNKLNPKNKNQNKFPSILLKELIHLNSKHFKSLSEIDEIGRSNILYVMILSFIQKTLNENPRVISYYTKYTLPFQQKLNELMPEEIEFDKKAVVKRNQELPRLFDNVKRQLNSLLRNENGEGFFELTDELKNMTIDNVNPVIIANNSATFPVLKSYFPKVKFFGNEVDVDAVEKYLAIHTNDIFGLLTDFIKRIPSLYKSLKMIEENDFKIPNFALFYKAVTGRAHDGDYKTMGMSALLRGYIKDPPGCSKVVLDVKCCELALRAVLFKHEPLELFRNEDADPYEQMGNLVCEIVGKELPNKREVGKQAVNILLNNGSGSTLKTYLGLGHYEAKYVIKDLKDKFRNHINEFNAFVESCVKKGEIEFKLGSRWYYKLLSPELVLDPNELKAKKVPSCIMQGAGALLLQEMILRIEPLLKAHNITLMYTIHDSLLLMVPGGYSNPIVPVIVELLNNIIYELLGFKSKGAGIKMEKDWEYKKRLNDHTHERSLDEGSIAPRYNSLNYSLLLTAEKLSESDTNVVRLTDGKLELSDRILCPLLNGRIRELDFFVDEIINKEE